MRHEGIDSVKTDTESKLEEAKFFMEQTRNSLISERYQEANFFINAFISSARSVTWIMQKEFDKNPGFNDWYSSIIDDNKEMLNPFNTLRTVSVHHRPISAKMYSQEIIFENGVTVEPGGDLVVDIESPEDYSARLNNMDIETVSSNIDIEIIEYHEGKKETVKMDRFVKKSNQYLLFLERLVRGCVDKFKQNSASQ